MLGPSGFGPWEPSAMAPSPYFAQGDRVVVVGRGNAVVAGIVREGARFEYVVTFEIGGAHERAPESMLRKAHPADCPHPHCQLPF